MISQSFWEFPRILKCCNWGDNIAWEAWEILLDLARCSWVLSSHPSWHLRRPVSRNGCKEKYENRTIFQHPFNRSRMCQRNSFFWWCNDDFLLFTARNCWSGFASWGLSCLTVGKVPEAPLGVTFLNIRDFHAVTTKEVAANQTRP